MGRAVRTSSGLLRVLGLAFGLALAVGGTVGSGIFRVPGAIVGGAGGVWPAALLIVLGGVQAMLSANVWAEVSTAVPLSGGSVVVVRRAFGDTAALAAGWTDALSCVAASAQLSVAGAGFLAMLSPALAPHVGTVAAALTLALALVNWRGVVVGEVAQIAVSVAKGAMVVALAAFLFWMAAPPYPPAPAILAPGPAMTAGGLLVAYQLVYGAFVGWSAPGYFSEETQDLGRAIPWALFLSVLIVTALYLLMLGGLAHALPLPQLAGADFPAALALQRALGPQGAAVLAAVAFVTVISCNNGNFLQCPRILLAMARAGYAPAALARVNRGGTPDLALLVFTALAMGLALTGRFELVFILMGTLSMALTAVCDAAFFRLRRREPDLPRPYRARGGLWLPGVALALDAAVLAVVTAADLRGAAFALGAVALAAVATRITRRAPLQAGAGVA